MSVLCDAFAPVLSVKQSPHRPKGRLLRKNRSQRHPYGSLPDTRLGRINLWTKMLRLLLVGLVSQRAGHPAPKSGLAHRLHMSAGSGLSSATVSWMRFTT